MTSETIQQNQAVPSQIELKKITPNGFETINSSEYFTNKTCIFFFVPGAFTPTCTNEHLPSFLKNTESFYEQGVDEIICVSCNDPFVVQAWANYCCNNPSYQSCQTQETESQNQQIQEQNWQQTQEQNSYPITFLSDGNCEFTEACGLILDASSYMMGSRSQRCVMLVRDNQVQHIEVETQPGCSISHADNILPQIAQWTNAA